MVTLSLPGVVSPVALGKAVGSAGSGRAVKGWGSQLSSFQEHGGGAVSDICSRVVPLFLYPASQATYLLLPAWRASVPAGTANQWVVWTENS